MIHIQSARWSWYFAITLTCFLAVRASKSKDHRLLQGLNLPANYQRITSNFIFYWQFLNNATVQMAFQWNSTGWIALAFGSGMINNDIITAELDALGNMILTDRYATQYDTPASDSAQGGRNDLQVLSTQSNGLQRTVIFQRLANTGDRFDAALSQGTVSFSWAAGSTGLLSYHGATRGYINNLNFVNGFTSDASISTSGTYEWYIYLHA